MRIRFHVVREANADDLPISYTWADCGPPEDLTFDEVKMILLYELADALKVLAAKP
jgi:hypothetical protein